MNRHEHEEFTTNITNEHEYFIVRIFYLFVSIRTIRGYSWLKFVWFYDNSIQDTVSFAQFSGLGVSTVPANGNTLRFDTHNGEKIEVSYLGHDDETTATLTISKKALTIANTTHTKQYDTTTTATGVTVTLNGVIADDTGKVTAGTVTAEYTNANAGTTTVNITAVALTGEAAENYTVTPQNGVTVAGITKANGGTVSSPAAYTREGTSLTITGVTSSNGQTIEYAINTANTAPSTGWQDSSAFTDTTIAVKYVFARAKENDNYNAGTASTGLMVITGAFNHEITLSNTNTTISANNEDNILIRDNGSSVTINSSSTSNIVNIYIAPGTVIQGTTTDSDYIKYTAIYVNCNSVITGLGSGINITGGRVSSDDHDGGHGIRSYNLTLAGIFDVISGGNSGTRANGWGGRGIDAIGNITITESTTIEVIKGGNGTERGQGGLRASGNIVISGTVGSISAGNGNSIGGTAMQAANITISGVTGNISGGNSSNIDGDGGDAIQADYSVLISGTTGIISGGINKDGDNSRGVGIYGNSLTITDTASISGIKGGDNDAFGIYLNSSTLSIATPYSRVSYVESGFGGKAKKVGSYEYTTYQDWIDAQP